MITAEAITEHKPLMFSIAYRMLGSASEAEDVVQEAFLRYHRASRRTTATTRSARPRLTCPP